MPTFVVLVLNREVEEKPLGKQSFALFAKAKKQCLSPYPRRQAFGPLLIRLLPVCVKRLLSFFVCRLETTFTTTRQSPNCIYSIWPLAIGLSFAVTGPMWPLIRIISWIPKKVSASFSRAALDARIWIAILLLLFVYGTAPEIYQRATQPKPQLQISIRNVNTYEINHIYGKVIVVIVDARIWNTGAQTYAVDWGLTALTKEKGRIVATLPNDTPQVEQALDQKTENTLVGDKIVTGKLLFYFRTDELSRAELLDPKTEIVLSVKDAYGNVTMDKESIVKWFQK
jgi:hypothetical protein